MKKRRLIFHVDVNNAYLSWTAVDYLAKGHPVDIRTIASIIGGDESKRKGIVLAKSPVAKKHGVVTAEPIYQARKKCSGLQVFPPNHDLYRTMSNHLYDYLKEFSPTVERFSVDECFLDMTGMELLYPDPIELAGRMKEEIKQRFGFTVNIGIAENKLCAKMASDFEKPDKVHTLLSEEIKTKLWPLPVEDLFLVGKKTAQRLHELGIDSIGDLAHTSGSLLRKHFKSMGEYLQQAALGIDETKVLKEKDRNKCISTTYTLPFDTDDETRLKKILFHQAEEVGREARRQNQYAKTIAVLFKTAQFVSYSHQKKLLNPTNVTEEIYRYALEVFEQGFRHDAVRLIGIRLADFTSSRQDQLSFFDAPTNQKPEKIQKTLDDIKDKYGSDMILPASFLTTNEKIRKK